MERYMRGFDFAPELTPYCRNTPQTVSIPVGQWRKCLGMFRMQALTYCDAEIVSTRTAVGQFEGQFKGEMDESSGKFKIRART